MSDAGRIQFLWPEPRQPRLSALEGAEEGADPFSPPAPPADGPPAPDFCLVILKVDEVDHVQLKTNRRQVHVRAAASGSGSAAWTSEEVNP